jgi:hypothetical protein
MELIKPHTGIPPINLKVTIDNKANRTPMTI